MLYSLLADSIVVVHALFVLFVIAGSFLVIRWRWIAWIHVPAAVWGALIEFQGWICPLTPLENDLRRLAGEGGYRGGFVETYLLRWLYPEGLTRSTQVWLGILVIVINVIGYSAAAIRWRRGSSGG